MAKHSKPEWFKENADGSADITLSRQADFSGVKMDVLRMREPTVDDTVVVSEMDGSDAIREIAAIANLCGQAPQDIRKLPLRDFKRLQYAYVSFID